MPVVVVDSVAVIGCGPGGMFFCHALETKRREMIARGESVVHLPHVTVFERASGPGGVWRSQRRSVSSSDPPAVAKEDKQGPDPREPQDNTQMVRSMEG